MHYNNNILKYNIVEILVLLLRKLAVFQYLKEHVDTSGNASELYSGDVRFETRRSTIYHERGLLFFPSGPAGRNRTWDQIMTTPFHT
jgi:hypothetical protein